MTARRWRQLVGAVVIAAGGETVLVRLGRRYGSAAAERAAALPGDDIVAAPGVVTNHAITIDAATDDVWPWLVQTGWGRAGWYTARWVDRLLFPANGASADRIVDDWQELHVGDFIPDGPPAAGCGFIVDVVEPNRALVLHSTSHLPARWRSRATVDWSWAFVLAPVDGATRTRFQSRSRWTTQPWWLTLLGHLAVVPADFLMAHDMLRGVKRRGECAAAADH